MCHPQTIFSAVGLNKEKLMPAACDFWARDDARFLYQKQEIGDQMDKHYLLIWLCLLNDDEIIFLLIEKFAQTKGHQIGSRFLPRKDKYEKALGSYLKSTEWDFCLKLSLRDFSVDLVDKHL